MSPMDFAELYRRHHDSVARYIEKMVGSTEGPDVTQEVFAKVDKALATFDGRAKMTTWIYRIATNTAIDWLRKKRRRNLEIPLFSMAETTTAGEGGEACGRALPGLTDAMIATQMNDCIREQVNKLPEKYRTVMILGSLDELDLSDIALILGISSATVKVRLHRARALLKIILEEECRFYANPVTGALACDRKEQTKAIDFAVKKNGPPQKKKSASVKKIPESCNLAAVPFV